MIRKIVMLIAIEFAVGLFLLAAALTFVIDNGAEPVLASSEEIDEKSEEGCIKGAFIATYQEKGIAFQVMNTYLCGANLRYSSTNADGLLVYNKPEVFD